MTAQVDGGGWAWTMDTQAAHGLPCQPTRLRQCLQPPAAARAPQPAQLWARHHYMTRDATWHHTAMHGTARHQCNTEASAAGDETQPSVLYSRTTLACAHHSKSWSSVSPGEGGRAPRYRRASSGSMSAASSSELKRSFCRPSASDSVPSSRRRRSSNPTVRGLSWFVRPRAAVRAFAIARMPVSVRAIACRARRALSSGFPRTHAGVSMAPIRCVAEAHRAHARSNLWQRANASLKEHRRRSRMVPPSPPPPWGPVVVRWTRYTLLILCVHQTARARPHTDAGGQQCAPLRPWQLLAVLGRAGGIGAVREQAAGGMRDTAAGRASRRAAAVTCARHPPSRGRRAAPLRVGTANGLARSMHAALRLRRATVRTLRRGARAPAKPEQAVRAAERTARAYARRGPAGARGAHVPQARDAEHGAAVKAHSSEHVLREPRLCHHIHNRLPEGFFFWKRTCKKRREWLEAAINPNRGREGQSKAFRRVGRDRRNRTQGCRRNARDWRSQPWPPK